MRGIAGISLLCCNCQFLFLMYFKSPLIYDFIFSVPLNLHKAVSVLEYGFEGNLSLCLGHSYLNLTS